MLLSSSRYAVSFPVQASMSPNQARRRYDTVHRLIHMLCTTELPSCIWMLYQCNPFPPKVNNRRRDHRRSYTQGCNACNHSSSLVIITWRRHWPCWWGAVVRTFGAKNCTKLSISSLSVNAFPINRNGMCAVRYMYCNYLLLLIPEAHKLLHMEYSMCLVHSNADVS